MLQRFWQWLTRPRMRNSEARVNAAIERSDDIRLRALRQYEDVMTVRVKR